jgi:predicted RNA-binding Zn-ribbon protein involved in translation (DUF1610 family)
LPSEIRTFFRHCPQCGRRFEIRLVDEEEVGAREAVNKPTSLNPAVAPVDLFAAASGRRRGFMHLADSGNPIVIDAREIQDTYRCGHCGHAWTELRQDDERLRVPSGAADELTEQDVNGPPPPKPGED